MSTALYRRYRPEAFDEVIGQEHVTRPLSAAIDAGRVNHAFLFSGPRGCGKTTSARILARCLNCTEGPTSNPCGECPSCRDLANGGSGSLDVVEIDAASHNGVDDARDLRERAVYAPARDRYKVFILDEAHMVTTQGFNALLKLVEEPPAHVKFVFATTEPDKVIQTIRSRTHHYPFRLVPPETLVSYLDDLSSREHVDVGRGVLPLVVRAGGGSVRDTLSVLDQLIAGADADGVDYATAVALLGYTDDALLGDIVDAFSAGDGAGVFRVIDRVIESGHDPRRFVEDLLERFRDLFVISAAEDAAASFLPAVPADRLERLKVQARAFGPAELSRAADLLNAGLTEMTGATSPRLQLELICARILLPGAEDSRRSVVSRVDRLERRIGMSAGGRMPAGAAPAQAGASQDRVDAPPDHADAPSGGARATPDGTDTAPHRSPTAAHDRTPGAAHDTPGAAQDTAHDTAQDADPFADVADAVASARSVLDGAREGATRGESEPRPHDGQPPAAQPPAAQPPAARPPEPAARAETAPVPEPTAPAERPQQHEAPEAHPSPEVRQAPGVGAEIDAVRRGWPDVLARLQQLRKLSYAIVSGNSFPQHFADGVLFLGFSNAGSVQAFRRGPHAQFVSTAVEDSLGIRAEVRVGDENAGPPPSGPASGGPQAGGPGAPGDSTAPTGPTGSTGPGGTDGRGPGPGAGGPAGRSGPRQVTQEELDSVVGPREADRTPVDHERFWQQDSPEPGGTAQAAAPTEQPTSPRGRESRDDAEGDSPAPLTVADAEQETPAPSAPATSVPASAETPPEEDVPSDPEPVGTAAGERAVDLGAVLVPPPVDIEPYPESEPYPEGEPYPDEDEHTPAPTTEDPPPPPPDGNSTPAGDLDFLGAYADVDIAFTENPGHEQAAESADTAESAGSPLGRYAHLAQRHSDDVKGAEQPAPPVEEHVPDPVENYTDYDTEGDADIEHDDEYGPAVVERILGGVIIEETRE
ncbi:MAG TPA: DNA polymerase III subunit gamma and tau [Brevibacterium sp.]|nr:DNA polymerase III subunit gamma and tau [Brevibacterium sp.]